MSEPRVAADEFLRYYRGRFRVLLSFGPEDYDPVQHGPFATIRDRDLGDLTDLKLPSWNPRGTVPLSSFLAGIDTATRAKGGVDYSVECRRRDLVAVTLIDPNVVRPPDPHDPRVSLETETGLRYLFGVADDEMRSVLLGKNGHQYAQYSGPASLEDIFFTLDQLKDGA